MRLGTILEDAGKTAVGVIEGDTVFPLPKYRDVGAFFSAGAAAFRAARRAIKKGEGRALSQVVLAAPIPRPLHFYAVGLNYAAHAREMGRATSGGPACFMKPAGCVVGPGATIVKPNGVSSLDYEAELAVVIGQVCRDVDEADAPGVVGGYTIVNDVSARDLLAPDRLTIAKGFDTFGPMGPWVVTADELNEIDDLRIRTWVGKQLRQDSSTADMIRRVPALIAWLSQGRTLYPGDVISTGSPPGSGASFNPPRFLAPGQRVTIEIERIGRLENTIIGGVEAIETRVSA